MKTLLTIIALSVGMSAQITKVQTTPSCTFNGAPPWVCTWTGTPVVGHLLHITADMNSANCTTLTPTCQDNNSNAYTMIQCADNSGQTIVDFYLAAPSGSTSVSCTSSGGAQQATILGEEWADLATSMPVDQTAFLAFFPCIPPATLPSITTTNADDLVIGSATSRGGNHGAWTAGSGYTLIGTLTDPTNNFSVGSEYQIVTMTSTYIPTMGCPGGSSLGNTFALEKATNTVRRNTYVINSQ